MVGGDGDDIYDPFHSMQMMITAAAVAGWRVHYCLQQLLVSSSGDGDDDEVVVVVVAVVAVVIVDVLPER